MIVVLGGLVNFNRHGHLNWRFALPFVLLSMPFAWLGGQIAIDRETFRLVLGIVLICRNNPLKRGYRSQVLVGAFIGASPRTCER